jgi:nucleoside-diphosphate-sugar epimerase
MANILVTGAGGFIGHHLVRHLVKLGHRVIGADLKWPDFSVPTTDKFVEGDFRYGPEAQRIFDLYPDIDHVYHLAADMGGIGWITTHHAEILRNNLLIDLNMIEAARQSEVKKFLFSSSACVYPEYRQSHPHAASLKESEVYPAQPEAAYGWEKLTTEKLCEHYQKDYGLETRITRFHNVYGPEETWQGGREKAPAALSRKIALAKIRGEKEIEVWGDGEQRRSFIYVSDVCKGLVALMESDYSGPVNIGNDETVSINVLAAILMDVAGYQVKIKHIEGPQGVRGRNSDNTLARKVLPNWKPEIVLFEGLRETYNWIESQVKASKIALIGDRDPTPDEIKRGLELEPLAQECLARNRK